MNLPLNFKKIYYILWTSTDIRIGFGYLKAFESKSVLFGWITRSLGNETLQAASDASSAFVSYTYALRNECGAEFLTRTRSKLGLSCNFMRRPSSVI